MDCLSCVSLCLGRIIAADFLAEGLTRVVAGSIDLSNHRVHLPHLHGEIELKIMFGQDGFPAWIVVVGANVIHEGWTSDDKVRGVSLLLGRDRVSLVAGGTLLFDRIGGEVLAEKGIDLAAVAACLEQRLPHEGDSGMSLHSSLLLKSVISAVAEVVALPRREGGDRDAGERAEEYIRRYYYRKDLSVEEIAGFAGVTPNHLAGVFRERIGMPVRQYLIRVRMEHAAALLNTGKYLVREVAVLSGWANQYYFSNSYKKYFGESPGRRRQPPRRHKP